MKNSVRKWYKIKDPDFSLSAAHKSRKRNNIGEQIDTNYYQLTEKEWNQVVAGVYDGPGNPNYTKKAPA